MRYKENKEGDSRLCKNFLLISKKIGDETRWLEYAVWEEVWKYDYWMESSPNGLFPTEGYRWVPVRWIAVEGEH